MEIISSTSNPQIKHLLKLQQKSSERKEQNLIVIEGWREIILARNAGLEIQKFFFCPEIFDRTHKKDAYRWAGISMAEVSPQVFSRIAYRENSDGIIALARPLHFGLPIVKLSKKPLVIVLENLEKPGNLGAILRTADAVAADAVIVCDPLTDIYNPNVIRASIGCVFTVPVLTLSSEAALGWLSVNNIHIFSAALQGAEDFYAQDLTSGCAFVLGTEATGLSSFWREHAHRIVRIPMEGHTDSLNVATTAAVMMFEAVRQRL